MLVDKLNPLRVPTGWRQLVLSRSWLRRRSDIATPLLPRTIRQMRKTSFNISWGKVTDRGY